MDWEEIDNSIPRKGTQQKVFGGSGARILEKFLSSQGVRIRKPGIRPGIQEGISKHKEGEEYLHMRHPGPRGQVLKGSLRVSVPGEPVSE